MNATVLFAFGVLLGMGCAPADGIKAIDTAEAQVAVAQYRMRLADCRAKGKAAKDFAVYEACVAAVDADVCRTRAVQCDGGAP